jgi:hypothetical protein
MVIFCLRGSGLDNIVLEIAHIEHILMWSHYPV